MGQLGVKLSAGLLPTTNAAGITTDGAGKRRYVVFDDTTAQTVRVSFVLPATFGSALKLKTLFACKNTQTGAKNVGLTARVDKRTPNSDAVDLETDSFDTDNDVTHALASGQSAGLLRMENMSLSNIDGAVAGDLVVLEIERDVAVASNMSGDLEILDDAMISWTDA